MMRSAKNLGLGVLGRISAPMACAFLGSFLACLPIDGNVLADDQQIPSVVDCSALSINPSKYKKFSATVSFSFANNLFKGERTTGNHPGKEVYSGSIDQSRLVEIKGRGAYYNQGLPWRSEFTGKVKESELTILDGTLDVENGSRRMCTLTFLLPPDKLTALFGQPSALATEGQTNSASPRTGTQSAQTKLPSSVPGQPENSPSPSSKGDDQTRKQLSDLAQDLADKQKQILAAQEDLKKRQAEIARDFAEKQKELRAASSKVQDEKEKLEVGQTKLNLATKDLSDRQRELEADHKYLKQEQANLKQEQSKTKDNVNLVQKLLDGIILPTTEDPDSWLVRVAAVPVQQQQFCRIIDQFYDSIGNVYQTHNDIKKNTLFRDRQLSMAALLPRGEFSNWVVQVKEVTQAPDGSAAIMLQPPCRAMLGSDACQKNGSKVQATIPPSSPLYRELSSVSAGDFVVVSGKILYAEAASDQPLPTYATYQAGSHCSSTEGSKQEDVFVTNITYLVQLR